MAEVGPTVAPSETKSPIAGLGVSPVTYDSVLEAIDTRPCDRAFCVTAASVHGVMSARRSPELAEAFARFDITTPDGMPLVWGLKLMTHPDQQRVYGPELMRKALVASRWRHYLYGSTTETLTALQQSIARFAPEATIAGAWSPPFRSLDPEERRDALERIRASGADVVWVGLGMPKQELWIAEVADELPGVALVAVGAAFDFLAGTKRQAPGWMQRSGLEWAFRVSQEPGRLWRRYVWNVPAFAGILSRQVLSHRLGQRPS